jgi:DNA polymerase-1
MEYEGVRIDTAELAAMSRRLTLRLDSLQTEAYKLAGHAFNISSPKQVGEVLFGELEIDPKARKTKNGAWSTTEDVLEKYRHKHPLVDIILEVRGVNKLLSTYVDALPKLINRETGKIHTTFNQTVTATGRISSTNPNLQNIPVRTDDGREIRRAFIPDEGNVMLSADYSQIELRLMADISGDPEMIEAFREGEDIHRATAAKIYAVSPDEVTDEQRRNAKTANFGIIYGISAFGLAERLAIPRSEAKELIEGYFRTYPRIREYISETIDLARENGYVTTVKGRKRYLPDINSRNATVRGYAERNAVNAPLQGSAADIIKIAMINIQHEMMRLNMRSRMIMQVHDELIFNVVPDEADTLQALVERLMQGAYSGKVSLTVASALAPNWLEAH